MKKVAIIGGGAAGFFTAANLADRTSAQITLYEASAKVLSKVLVSGGGRCNVTNRISDPEALAAHYPRGHRFLPPVFRKFTSSDTQRWFTTRGVPLKTEDDGRVFPRSNTSQSIYDCLVKHSISKGVSLKTKHRLEHLEYNGKQWLLKFKEHTVSADYVVLATGCTSKLLGLAAALAIPTVDPVPSLFTFNVAQHALKSLSGVSVNHASISIAGSQAVEHGPLLVTHWGYSGPAALRLSAWHAIELAQRNYQCRLNIAWNAQLLEEEVRAEFKSNMASVPKQKVSAWAQHQLPKRLWTALLEEANIQPFTNWSEIGKKGIERLLTALFHYPVDCSGKTTFKEEFVTAGGIDLEAIDPSTFSIKGYTNLYAVGEILNIDAITGGFNFQAAWSGGYLVANSIAEEVENS